MEPTACKESKAAQIANALSDLQIALDELAGFRYGLTEAPSDRRSPEQEPRSSSVASIMGESAAEIIGVAKGIRVEIQELRNILF